MHLLWHAGRDKFTQMQVSYPLKGILDQKDISDDEDKEEEVIELGVGHNMANQPMQQMPLEDTGGTGGLLSPINYMLNGWAGRMGNAVRRNKCTGDGQKCLQLCFLTDDSVLSCFAFGLALLCLKSPQTLGANQMGYDPGPSATVQVSDVYEGGEKASG